MKNTFQKFKTLENSKLLPSKLFHKRNAYKLVANQIKRNRVELEDATYADIVDAAWIICGLIPSTIVEAE